MDNEEFLNSLRQVNTLLDEQLSRLDSIERKNPNQAQYLKQMHKAFFKGECCDPCFVLPSVGTCGGGGSPFSCDGAIDRIMVGAITDGGLIDVYVDDVLVVAESNCMFRLDGIAPALADFDIEVIPYDESGNEITVENVPGRYYSVERALFKNLSGVHKRIRIELVNANSVDTNYTPENAAFDHNLTPNITTFCLAPKPDIDITIARETEDNNPVVYLVPSPNVPMSTATVTVYISDTLIDVDNLQNYYSRDVPLTWDGRRTTRIFGNTGVDQYVLYTVEYDNQRAISNVLVIRNGLEFNATNQMPAESCVIDDHNVVFTILQTPSFPTSVVPPQYVGYLTPSGVDALIALDNQTQNIANFTGGTGTSHFYIEYVVEQVPVAAVAGIDQLQAGVAPSKLNESGTNTSTKYNNVRHSYYQRTPQGSPHPWTSSSYLDANLVAFAAGDTIGFGMHFIEASQVWGCQLFKNHVFVKDLIGYSHLSINNSQIYLFGLCFGEFIQIGETYKVRLGDQTFKPYGDNTTYL